mgnify:FL=1
MNKELRIAFIGASGVGKSSFINALVGNNFSPDYYPTFGVTEYVYNDWINLFDFSGLEYTIYNIKKLKYKLTQLNINFIFFICDCVNKISYKHIQYLKKEINNIEYIILSNKFDLSRYAYEFGDDIYCKISVKKNQAFDLKDILLN